MMVTESVWVMPMAYATEGPFLVAAYQSLTGIDAYYWFNTWDEEWSHPQSANGYLRSQQKWMFANPDMLGNFPAAALMYRMGYVRQGDPVVLELRELKDLWQRRTPLVAETPSFDPNRDAGDIAPQSSVKTGVDVRAFLVGPVEVVFDRDPAQTEVVNLAPYLLDGGKIIRSITGELELNTDKGCATLDAPKAQGVAAFFKNRQQFKLTDVEIISRNDYGAVLVVSMDDKPLRQSARILVQAGTQSRPSEWQEQPKQLKTSDGRVIDAFEVVNFGKAPWQVIKPDVEITVSNTGLAKAIVLDMNGNARGEAPLTRNAAGVKLRFPEDAMYVVLQ